MEDGEFEWRCLACGAVVERESVQTWHGAEPVSRVPTQTWDQAFSRHRQYCAAVEDRERRP